MALWSLAVAHAMWIKNCVFTHSLEPSNSPYQVYFGRKPNLSSLHLFGCKAYLHTPKINQSKFSECSTECVHVGFAPKKSAYTLYNREKRHLFESRDVEFEEPEEQSQKDINSDSDEDETGDPEGHQSILDQQEVPGNKLPSAKALGIGSDTERNTVPSLPASPTPTSIQASKPPNTQSQLHHCTHRNMEVPPMHADEDPKLELGSRCPVTNPTDTSSGGAEITDDSDDGALYLTVDAPQSYRDAIVDARICVSMNPRKALPIYMSRLQNKASHQCIIGSGLKDCPYMRD